MYVWWNVHVTLLAFLQRLDAFRCAKMHICYASLLCIWDLHFHQILRPIKITFDPPVTVLAIRVTHKVGNLRLSSTVPSAPIIISV